VRDYKTAYGHEVGTFSLPAYDATRLLIAAIGRAIDDAGGALPTRGQVLRQVSASQEYRGAMGTTSFDVLGDTTLKLITAYQWLGANDAAGQFVAQPLIAG
jgi:ABC-type branched-subunit amino acid transport system substrate-binding protein